MSNEMKGFVVKLCKSFSSQDFPPIDTEKESRGSLKAGGSTIDIEHFFWERDGTYFCHATI